MSKWTVSHDAHYLLSGDFEVDASLRISGDFRDEEHRRQYAQMLARKLNGATEPECNAEPQGVKLSEDQFEALADWMLEMTRAAISAVAIKRAEITARIAFGLPAEKEQDHA